MNVKEKVRLQVQLAAAAPEDASGIDSQVEMIVNGTDRNVADIPADSEGPVTIEGLSDSVMFERSESVLTIHFHNGHYEVVLAISVDNVSF